MSEKSRYTDTELDEFKSLISGKLSEAQKDLDFYKKQMADRADNPDSKLKGLDDGIGTREAERLTELAGRTKKYIAHLQNALIRIENKVYGVCRDSGKLISKERLRAVPHATLSMHAKMKQSK